MSVDRRSYRVVLVVVLASLWFLPARAQTTPVKTPAEESQYQKYTQHEDIVRFLGALDQASRELTVQVIGQTREVRQFPSKDLYLCIINEAGASTPQALDRTRPTLMLIASQHGNEQSGKEAALALIRDLTVGDLRPLLQKVNFLIVPQSNPYGNQFDQRQNEQDLDTNRDHVRLDSATTRALHGAFREWMPEVTFDAHEKGDDYYRVSTGMVSNPNTHQTLQQFSRQTILPEVEAGVEKEKVTWHEYLVEQPMGIDSSAGARYSPEDTASRETMMRYSTADINDGRGSFGIYETLSFIQECASRHDVETLQQRTRWQYVGMRALIDAVVRHASEVVTLVGTRRKALLDEAGTYSPDHVTHLRIGYVRDPKQPELTLSQFERTDSPIRGVLKVDKKAGEPVSAGDLAPYRNPAEYKVVQEVVKNWFPDVEPRLSVPRPLGYVIPSGHRDVVEVLLGHGVAVSTFTRDVSIDVEIYRASEVIPAQYDFLPPDKIEVEKSSMQTVARTGDFFVPVAQPAANAIACFLEPQSEFGLIRYRSLHLVPKSGEVFFAHRVVKEQALPVVPYQPWRSASVR